MSIGDSKAKAEGLFESGLAEAEDDCIAAICGQGESCFDTRTDRVGGLKCPGPPRAMTSRDEDWDCSGTLITTSGYYLQSRSGFWGLFWCVDSLTVTYKHASVASDKLQAEPNRCQPG
ncbi:hypothetical protein J3459_010144 [Metarhizium acridum]|uniref:uncharacterized protein n=1 Tax=Metarhizium acridum TaxID=92637 RepID=UPI001C6C0BDB|nr:hypothetical protein J3459_010144 [Metarhizium acridum]KAG8424939.1 hypothetical protein J3458_001693 [Metarhizium acridum]